MQAVWDSATAIVRGLQDIRLSNVLRNHPFYQTALDFRVRSRRPGWIISAPSGILFLKMSVQLIMYIYIYTILHILYVFF